MNKGDFFIYIYNLIELVRYREHREIALSQISKNYNETFENVKSQARSNEDLAYYHHFFSDVLKAYEFLSRNSVLTPEHLHNLLKDTPVYPNRLIPYSSSVYGDIDRMLRNISNNRTDLKAIDFFVDNIDKPHSLMSGCKLDFLIVRYRLHEFFSEKK